MQSRTREERGDDPMTELEKMKAGLEYCYDDEEVDALKEQAIIWCARYNALAPLDFAAQRAMLKEHLGSVGERVCRGQF